MESLRTMQRAMDCVWLAVYDDDLLYSNFLQKISLCSDTCLPWESVPWRLSNFEVFLINENCLSLRAAAGKEVLCKLFLVTMDQVHDIVRQKNQANEIQFQLRKSLLTEEQKEISMVKGKSAAILDMVYQESIVMGLPIVIALNREYSKLDDSIPQASNRRSESLNFF